MDNKILLMYISNVSGHHSATLAIEQAINAFNPHPQVLNINGFSYAYPTMEKIVNTLYMAVIKICPNIWDFLYDNPVVIKNTGRFKEYINKKNRDKIGRLIKSENCKVIICSQAFPCGMVADYKKCCYSDLKLIAVVTDFIPHSYWVYEEVDFYIVGSPEAKETLLKKGIEEKKVKLFGIPIDPKFFIGLDKKAVADELNIKLDKPIVLVMGGSHGFGPIKDLVNALDSSNINAKFFVVAGANKRLFNWLNSRKFKKEFKVFGYTNIIAKLMTVSDILITKPGGITTAEALAKNLPMIIIRPIPGQEQNNTNFLLKYEAAKKAESVEDTIDKLGFLLSNANEIMLIKEKISKIAKPFSSVEIAKLALSLC